MFEHKTAPLVPRRLFLLRLARMGAIAAGIIFAALMIGTLGYKSLEGLSWIDSVLNASMILGGMGPIHCPVTTAGKLFASGYALFSGIVFLTVAAVLFAPLAHRMIHRFHLQIAEEDEDVAKPNHRRESKPRK